MKFLETELKQLLEELIKKRQKITDKLNYNYQDEFALINDQLMVLLKNNERPDISLEESLKELNLLRRKSRASCKKFKEQQLFYKEWLKEKAELDYKIKELYNFITCL